MPLKQYRCIVDALNIRTEPKDGDQYKTGDLLKFNQIITVDEDSRVDASDLSWLKHERGWSVERSLDGRLVYLTDALQPRDRILGINIDPNNPKANPPAEQLTGVGWVRFVLHVASRQQTLDQAFAFYDPIIRAYAQAGTRIILILLQDTYIGNMPWVNGDWGSYMRGFAEMAGILARRYRGMIAAYQIWNEGDVSGAETSHYIAPQNYAPLLLAASQAIGQADPSAKVITGGLAGSNSLEYMRGVQSALGGLLPIDGIALHPYGQIPPDSDAEPFPGWSTGSLGSFLLQFARAFPRIPIWITEIGVPRVDVANESYWPPIANYMAKTFAYLRSAFCHLVPVVVWFAWSDPMDRAGIVTENQKPKGVLYNTFFNAVNADYPGQARVLATPYDGKIMLVHVSGQTVQEQTIGELVTRMNAGAPNAKALLVKTSAGKTWQGQSDSKKNLAIAGPADLGRWSAELLRSRIDLHAWHDIQGADLTAEVALIRQVGTAPGVLSVVLNLEATTLAIKQSKDIRAFMINVRRALPEPFPLGLSFDGRPELFPSVALLEWYPFITAWHPKIYPRQYNPGPERFGADMAALFNALKPYPKPVVPMLFADPTATEPMPAEPLRAAARLLLDTYRVPGLTFWRLGATGTFGFDVIRGTRVPWLAGLSPAAAVATLTSQGAVRIRTVPSQDGVITGQFQPGEQVLALERRVIGNFEWIRHSRGWSAARNTATGEVFLA